MVVPRSSTSIWLSYIYIEALVKSHVKGQVIVRYWSGEIDVTWDTGFVVIDDSPESMR